MSGTLVPMSIRVPAGTHQNLKILGTGYRENFINWVLLGEIKIYAYRWVPGTSQKKFLGTGGYLVPAKFSTMPTPDCHQ